MHYLSMEEERERGEQEENWGGAIWKNRDGLAKERGWFALTPRRIPQTTRRRISLYSYHSNQLWKTRASVLAARQVKRNPRGSH